ERRGPVSKCLALFPHGEAAIELLDDPRLAESRLGDERHHAWLGRIGMGHRVPRPLERGQFRVAAAEDGVGLQCAAPPGHPASWPADFVSPNFSTLYRV